MTKKQKQVLIAEACDWIFCPVTDEIVTDDQKAEAVLCWVAPKGDEWHQQELPDYFADLNACRDFKNHLKGDELTDFINKLYNLTFNRNMPDRDYGVVFAEAEHYCEAFGWAKKLW